MKKRITLLIGVLLVLSIFLAACAPKESSPVQGEEGYPQPGSEQSTVSEEGYPKPGVEQPAESGSGYPAPDVVLIATDATFPPFEMVDENTKELIGFDIELMKAVADKAGINYEFVNLPFDPMLAGLAQCQYDMAIAAITITEERKEEFLFSNPYIDAGQIIVVKAGNENIKSKDDLSGKTIGAQLGTTGEIEAKAIDGVNYKPYDTYDLAFLDLANGQIDAVIADYPTALGFIAKNPDKLKTVGEKFTDESYGIAICKNRGDLLEKINPALQAVIDAGVVDQLAAKYLAGE